LRQAGGSFISDGYGNARILEYSSSGERLRVWGTKGSSPGQFQIPHGIANDGKVLYVADRENARIQWFDFEGHCLALRAPSLSSLAEDEM
jgi:peptidylamidoglycolate lyase